ncbi:unnamed protein product [Polarella glacialis]|uniref:SbsA Ig-like domain-containing protein n=1 Tax=Polarella glacialis TaxID=89957 RepID=A0A813G2A1_POLGL|nr:unnamed protein product [Polarella glacialis]
MVLRYTFQMTSLHPLLECSDYAPGWEGNAVSTNGWSKSETFSGFTIGTASDNCTVGGSPCLCADIAGCSWREHTSGGKRCQATEAGADSVACEDCSQQTSCPPTCTDATMACACAAVRGVACHWQELSGSCGPVLSGSVNVSCKACTMQDVCQALLPKPVSYTPAAGTFLTASGAGAEVRITFDNKLQTKPSGLGGIQLACGMDGSLPDQSNPSKTKAYTLPASAASINDQTITLNMSMVLVNQESACELLMDEGFVYSDGNLPSKRIDFGSYIMMMPDTGAPWISSFSPKNTDQDVPVSTSRANVTFDEDVILAPAASASLTPLDVIGGASLGPTVNLPIVGVAGREISLNLEGLLQKGTIYTLTLSSTSIVDRSGHYFKGLQDGVYTFRTAGVKEDVRLYDSGATETIPKEVMYGLTPCRTTWDEVTKAVSMANPALDNLPTPPRSPRTTPAMTRTMPPAIKQTPPMSPRVAPVITATIPPAPPARAEKGPPWEILSLELLIKFSIWHYREGVRSNSLLIKLIMRHYREGVRSNSLLIKFIILQ